ncbi:MAG: spore coat protein [Clostridiales bacterium]|nr:spore coat protein [Clostridiales bacterium]
MANIIQELAGVGDLTEQVIATDLLISSKNAIKSYAAALAESTTPNVKNVLKRQLDDAIKAHDKITSYMMNKGYYNAYEPQAQIEMAREASDTVMSLNNPD